MSTTIDLPLLGGGGEPVDLPRTLNSHGFADLPPMRLVDGALELTLRAGRWRPRTVRISPSGRDRGVAEIAGHTPGGAQTEAVRGALLHVLRMDEDLSPLYAMTANDPDLAWVARGAGRMLRSPTVFEDVVKTICATNCAWSATERMVGAIVQNLGERSPGAPADGPWGRAFPSPEDMAEAGERFYRDVARAGYRAAYLVSLARSVAEGSIDLEQLAHASPEDLPDDELERLLLALPGVGPYAAAHIMLTIGRYSRLILDSWTRPKYALLAGKRKVSDAAIERRFRRYGRFAGLAFWLFVTRDWIEEP